MIKFEKIERGKMNSIYIRLQKKRQKALFKIIIKDLYYSAVSGETAIIRPVASPKSPALIIFPSSLKVK